MALIHNSEWIDLLREENFATFNERARREPPDLENADLRLVDLRKAHLQSANLRGAYLRNADLRGVDLSKADLEGASIHDACVGGCLFPSNLRADEISASVATGMRMRTVPS